MVLLLSSRTDGASGSVDDAASTTANDASQAVCNAGRCVGDGAGGCRKGLKYISDEVHHGRNSISALPS